MSRVRPTIPGRGPPRTLMCELHRTHSPTPLTAEQHHVIPVAWQLFWAPETAPFPGKDPDGRGMLWDTRTVTCCPTGHRNVHVWIVRMMRDVSVGDRPSDQATATTLTARLALLRFEAVGGSLAALVAAHEWGIA